MAGRSRLNSDDASFAGARTQGEVCPGLLLRRTSVWADAFLWGYVPLCLAVVRFVALSSAVALVLLPGLISATDEAVISVLPATIKVRDFCNSAYSIWQKLVKEMSEKRVRGSPVP